MTNVSLFWKEGTWPMNQGGARSSGGRRSGKRLLVFRTLKEECVWLHRFESIEQVEKAIGVWLEKYNTQRPHESLGWLTPFRWRESHAA